MLTRISTTTAFEDMSLFTSDIVTIVQLITIFPEFAITVEIPVNAVALTFVGLIEVGLIRFADEITSRLAGLRVRAAAAAATLVLALAGTFIAAAAAAAVGDITALRSPLRLRSFLR